MSGIQGIKIKKVFIGSDEPVLLLKILMEAI
jgi:hypothetical protein